MEWSRDWWIGIEIGDWGLGSYSESLRKISSQVTMGFVVVRRRTGKMVDFIE
jgi:hypothetical protein